MHNEERLSQYLDEVEEYLDWQWGTWEDTNTNLLPYDNVNNPYLGYAYGAWMFGGFGFDEEELS